MIAVVRVKNVAKIKFSVRQICNASRRNNGVTVPWIVQMMKPIANVSITKKIEIRYEYSEN